LCGMIKSIRADPKMYACQSISPALAHSPSAG
jgi:hypothetical protein